MYVNYYIFSLNRPTKENIIKTQRLTKVIQAPVGTLSMIIVKVKPIKKHTTLIITDAIITFKNDLNTLIADSAGKTIRLDTSSAPTSFTEITTLREVKIANKVSYIPGFIPTAFENSSSKVAQNILL